MEVFIEFQTTVSQTPGEKWFGSGGSVGDGGSRGRNLVSNFRSVKPRGFGLPGEKNLGVFGCGRLFCSSPCFTFGSPAFALRLVI